MCYEVLTGTYGGRAAKGCILTEIATDYACLRDSVADIVWHAHTARLL